MNLKLLIPEQVLIDQQVTRIIAEAENGHFCLLPKHIDMVAPLVPGLLTYTSEDDEETLAVDTGVLVKVGDEVLVSVRHAVRGEDISDLQQTVRNVFMSLKEKEKKSRAALARLEAAFVTDFLGMQEEI
jgi:F-type H+-transporting ATPase subunit epsilon